MTRIGLGLPAFSLLADSIPKSESKLMAAALRQPSAEAAFNLIQQGQDKIFERDNQKRQWRIDRKRARRNGKL